MTAQILVGDAHPNHGGLYPLHVLFLSENSMPAWILTPQRLFSEGDIQAELERHVWIPQHPNTMLDDALMMIAVHAVRDEGAIALAKACFTPDDQGRVFLQETDASAIERLHAYCQQLSFPCKLVVTLFEGSSLQGQLGALAGYNVDIEVCTPSYSRLSSQWSEGVVERGSLAGKE